MDMDFGRIKDARNVDFSLPPDHPATLRVLGKGGGGPIDADTRVHVGCPVWQDDAMARKLLRDAYFFTHMDPVDMTVELSARFFRSLNALGGVKLKEPILQAEIEEPSLGL